MQSDSSLNEFRADLRAILRRELPEDIRLTVAKRGTNIPPEMIRRWQKILFNLGGWSCPNWTKEDGGPGWSLEQQYIFHYELALAQAPPTRVFNHGMLGPAIIDFGTEYQKRKFLPGIADGSVILCQGYSEPNAGSDLASLKCRAERQGEEYIINGSKMWTSSAHIADLMFGLFRTSLSEKKQAGISVLLVDMRSPGLTVTPIITYEGSHEVNQVFFDNVRVPVENCLGAENAGWAIAKIILSYERFGSAEVGHSAIALERLKQLSAAVRIGDRKLIESPDFCRRLADVEIDLRALALTEQRILLDSAGGAEASLLKIRGTEIQNEIFELTVEALGVPSIYDTDESTETPVGFEGFDQSTRVFLNMRKTLIYSGSNEILKNIIAKTVLGLR